LSTREAEVTDPIESRRAGAWRRSVRRFGLILGVVLCGADLALVFSAPGTNLTLRALCGTALTALVYGFGFWLLACATTPLVSLGRRLAAAWIVSTMAALAVLQHSISLSLKHVSGGFLTLQAAEFTSL
jgi:hypothetical protein